MSAYPVVAVCAVSAAFLLFITAALKLNKGKYSNFLIYSAKEDPGLASGSKVKMYGKCIGPHQIQSEEGNTSYPAFDFLFFE